MARTTTPRKERIVYSQAIADEICNKMATSTMGIGRLCKENLHWPSRAEVYRWVFEHPSFRDQYARAKAMQVEWLVEEALEIAYDGSNDTYIDDKGNSRCDNEWVARSRLKVDTIKWFASKLAPKIYGDKKENDDKNNNNAFVSQNRDKIIE
jgi:hypothetical protein